MIIVRGLASGRIVKRINVPDKIPSDLSLMDFLMKNGVTIASSCGGAGTCKKCYVNKDLLSCQIELKDYVLNFPDKEVEVSYL